MATEFQVTFDSSDPAATRPSGRGVALRPSVTTAWLRLVGRRARRVGHRGRSPQRQRGSRRSRRRRAAAVLPEGARVEDGQEPRGISTCVLPPAYRRRAARTPSRPSAPGWSRSALVGCGDWRPTRSTVSASGWKTPRAASSASTNPASRESACGPTRCARGPTQLRTAPSSRAAPRRRALRASAHRVADR